MTETPARSKIFARQFPLRWSGAFFISVALLLSGCSMRKKPSIPWATAVQVKPTARAHPAATSDASDGAAPDLWLELPPIATVLIPVRSGPARPRMSAPTSTNSGSDADRTEAPMIAPQLTPQETAVAQQETNQSLNIAEKNLARTRGKSLNAAQSDLASKVRSFLKDAREAAQGGDWGRARSLAKKAQVLSEELAGSL